MASRVAKSSAAARRRGGEAARIVDREIERVLDAVELRARGHRAGDGPRHEGGVSEPPPHRPQRLQADRHAAGARGFGQAEAGGIVVGSQHAADHIGIADVPETQLRAQRLGFDTEIQEGEDRVGTIALARADLGMCQRLAVVQVIAQRQARADRRMAEQLRDKRCAVHRLQPGRPQDALQAVHVVGAPLTWRSR